MSDLRNVELGACALSVDGADVGVTSGPTVLRIEPIWRPLREERHGEALADQVCLGARVRVEATIEEKTLDNLMRALPDGLDGTAWLGVGRAPGTRLGALAAEVRLHPLESADASKDVVLHRAAAQGPVEIAYQEGRPRAFRVAFVALVDETKDDGERLARLYQA